MTKEEYLNQLKNNLLALSEEERAEAMDYYAEYLEEVEDLQKTLEDLGSPEDLAQTIKDKIACVPEKIASDYSQEEQSTDEHCKSEDYDYEPMKFNFSVDQVKNLDLSLGAAQIVIIPGEDFCVETRGICNSTFRCVVTNQNTLIVDTNFKKIPTHIFKNKKDFKSFRPRILIRIPENVQFDAIKIGLGGGYLQSKDVTLNCKTGQIEVGAGNMVISKLIGNKMSIRCGMGHLKVNGILTGNNKLVCGMGKMQLDLQGKKEDYSFESKVGLGEVVFNDEKKSGIADYVSNNKKTNHFVVSCALGAVNINIK